MSLDSRLTHYVPKPVSEPPDLRQQVSKQSSGIPTTKIIFVDESRKNAYPDILEEPVLLVSEKMKRILGMYRQPGAVFETVILIERKKNQQHAYYQVFAPEIQCRVDMPDNSKGNKAEGLVLDEIKIGYARIFYVNYYGKRLIVRLDVAESILRRDSFGVRFNRVITVGKDC